MSTLETQVSIQDRLMEEFRSAKGLKARLIVAHELIKNLGDFTDASAVVTEAEATHNAEITSHQQTQPALALEAIFVRDDLRRAAGAPAAEGELTTASVWSQNLDFGEVFEQIPATKHKQALQSFRETFPAYWQARLLGLINRVSARFCGECARLLIHENHLESLKDTLARLISEHNASNQADPGPHRPAPPEQPDRAGTRTAGRPHTRAT